MKTHLPDPGRKSQLPRKVFSRQRRSGSPWREAGMALLNGAAGIGVLLLLMQLPSRLDSLLVLSKVISALIRGLSEIGKGLISLLVGLLQASGAAAAAGPGDRGAAVADQRGVPPAAPGDAGAGRGAGAAGGSGPTGVVGGAHPAPDRPER